MSFEELNGALVLLSSLACFEGTEIAVFPSLWILFARIQAIFAGPKLANHTQSPLFIMARRCFSGARFEYAMAAIRTTERKDNDEYAV